MAKKIGGNQRASRKSKLNMMIGDTVLVNFLFQDEKKVDLRGKIERRENGYFLGDCDVQIPLKSVKFNGYERVLVVTVPKGSYMEKQLKQLKDVGVVR